MLLNLKAKFEDNIKCNKFINGVIFLFSYLLFFIYYF
jgi:hypothetical protein